MNEKKEFELPSITTFDRDELIVETAFTGTATSAVQSDRALKADFSPVAGREVLARLLRFL